MNLEFNSVFLSWTSCSYCCLSVVRQPLPGYASGQSSKQQAPEHHLVWWLHEGLHARAGRILNVAVCPADTNEPPRVLNYLTAPHVYVWSAVSCSSAFPLLFAPQELKCRSADGEEVM